MTAFHISTYLKMGGFDTRNRFSKIRADGGYEGVIIGGTGESVSVNAVRDGVNVGISMKFQMGAHSVVLQDSDPSVLTPTGTATYVSSE